MTYWPTWKRMKSAGWKVRTQLNRFAACVCECTARTAPHYSRPAYPAWLHCWQLLGAVRKAFVCITAESPWCTSCLLKNPGDSSGLINFSEERTWRHILKNDAPLTVSDMRIAYFAVNCSKWCTYWELTQTRTKYISGRLVCDNLNWGVVKYGKW